jgi:hypothetical protein
MVPLKILQVVFQADPDFSLFMLLQTVILFQLYTNTKVEIKSLGFLGLSRKVYKDLK